MRALFRSSSPASSASPHLPLVAAELTQRLAVALLGGASIDEAVNGCNDPRATQASVFEEAQRIMSDPLFKAALLERTRLRCARWHMRAQAALALTPGAGPVVRTGQEIPADVFLRDYYSANRAVYLPGLAAHWPAVYRWEPKYLADACGDMTVEIMSGRNEARVHERNTAAHLTVEVPWAEYVAQVFGGGSSNDYYLVSRNLFVSRPSALLLLEDIVRPPYVFIDDPAHDIRLWFGPGGTRTPLHYDGMNNLIVQLRGTKVVRLYPPCCAEAMDQQMPWYAGRDPRESELGEDLHLFASLETELTLNPGDALFIPVGWWHALEARDPAITVAFVNFGVANDYPLRTP